MIDNILNPIEKVFKDEKLRGETLVDIGRFVVVLLIYPLILLRIYSGDISKNFFFLSIIEWILLIIYPAIVYYFIQNKIYDKILGYMTLFFDLLFLSSAILVLSFYRPEYNGFLNEPFWGICFIVCYSSALRFEYKYSVFCIFNNLFFMALLLYLDYKFHDIPVNYISACNMTIAILMVTAMATLFTRGFRNVILSSYFNLEKHAKEISTILKLSKTISSKEELKNILSNIADELKELLSSDFTRISIIEDDSSNGMSDIFLNDTISKKTDEQKLLTKIKMIERLLTTKKEAVVIKNPSDFEKIDDSLLLSQLKSSEMTAIMGWPIKIENEVYGTIVTGKYRKTYTDYDATLLGILSEHAAISIKNAKMLEQLHNESAYFESKITEIEKFENIIGKSPKMQSVFKIIEKAAKTDIPVIVRGESGTGKELVATALQNLSIRRDEPFIKINCAAIPKELMESELFGHEKGAFTGADIRKIGKIEQADKGTLFLDEIGDMSLGLQVKLLRVLQENTFERVGGNDPIKVDFRLISATNQNLEEQIRIGKFRKDLFYRINGLPIFLPSLHERKEDIHLLVRFLSQKYKNNRVKDIQFTNSAMKLLVEKKWEGNVRELENLIYRIITMVDQDVISADDIWRISPPEEKIQHFSSTGDIDAYIQNTIKEGCKINEEINRFEKKFLEQTLNMCGRSMVKACDLIGIKKTTLYYKVNKYNISI